MSHIHLPDGVIPYGWAIGAYLLTTALLFFSLKRIRREDVRRKVPYVGVLAALMLITMSVPLGFIPFHLNLAVLIGILAGPALGFVVIFVVNILLSFLGHGGITVVGINTLIIGAEVMVGSGIFRLFGQGSRFTLRTAVATCAALIVSSALMAGLIIMSNTGLAAALPHQHEEHKETQEVHAEERKEPVEEHGTESLQESLKEVHFLFATGWTAVAVILFGGIFLETLVTVFIVGFFMKVRPELLFSPGSMKRG